MDEETMDEETLLTPAFYGGWSTPADTWDIFCDGTGNKVYFSVCGKILLTPTGDKCYCGFNPTNGYNERDKIRKRLT
jgi:hypothetical protein